MNALVLLPASWAVVAVLRIFRARGLSLMSGACIAFFLVSLCLVEPGPVQRLVTPFGYGLLADLGWLTALALMVRWLLLGYAGTAAGQLPWLRRLNWVVPILSVSTIVISRTPALWSSPGTVNDDWLLARWWVVHLTMLAFAAGVVALAALGLRVTRARHRISVIAFVGGGWLACEAVMVDLIGGPRPLPFMPSELTAALLAGALTLFLVGMGLPFLPYHRRRDDPRVVPALEQVWTWLSPSAPPLRIDEQSDTGVWVSDAVIALRDRIGALQAWCPPSALTLAEQAWRRSGLPHRQARAMAAAECLWRARRAEERNEPTVGHQANLIGMGGGRWLDQELSWFLSLHSALGRIVLASGADRHAADQPGVPLADPELIERCERRLEEWLPSPRPATMSAIRAIIAHRRERPIGVVPCDELSARAYYAKVLNLDLLLVDSRPSELMRLVAQGHELGHLICEHQTLSLDGPDQRQAAEELRAATPDLSPSLLQGLLARCDDWQNDPVEAEAEITGRLIVRHILHAPGAGLAHWLDER